MADLSALGGLRPVEQLNLENYADVKERSFQLPKAGIYTLRTTDTFTPASFGTTKNGDLSISIEPTIVGPEHEGFPIKFVKISGKVYQRSKQNVSQIGDYLRSVGFRGALADAQAQADAVENTAGQTFQAYVDWKVYNKNTGFSLEGMKRFPLKKDPITHQTIAGEYQSWVEDPNDFEKDEVGNNKLDDEGNKIPKRLRANLFVREYIPVRD